MFVAVIGPLTFSSCRSPTMSRTMISPSFTVERSSFARRGTRATIVIGTRRTVGLDRDAVVALVDLQPRAATRERLVAGRRNDLAPAAGQRDCQRHVLALLADHLDVRRDDVDVHRDRLAGPRQRHGDRFRLNLRRRGRSDPGPTATPAASTRRAAQSRFGMMKCFADAHDYSLLRIRRSPLRDSMLKVGPPLPRRMPAACATR